MYGVGHILGRQRLRTLVHGGGPVGVAGEADGRKLSACHQARLDICHTHPGSGQVGAQIEAELADKGLGRAIDVAAGIGPVAGDRTDVDHVPTVTRHHSGQHGVRDGHEPFHVGVDHGVPVIEARALRRVHAQGQARVVDQYIGIRELRRQPRDGGQHGVAVAHVEREGVGVVTQLGQECVEPVLPAAGQHDAMPFGGKSPGDGQAEPGGGPGDEDVHARAPSMRVAPCPISPAEQTAR